jgi:hypothetical protein
MQPPLIRVPFCIGALLLVLLTQGAASAQSVLVVRVMAAGSGQPVQGAMVRVTGRDPGLGAGRLTDAFGRALFELDAGAYRVEAEMIGHRAAVRERIELASDAQVDVELSLLVRALPIRGLEVAAGERCRLRPEVGLQVAEVWDEIRKALEAARWTSERGVYQYRVETRTRDLEWRTGQVLAEERTAARGYSGAPFESLTAARLAEDGFVQPSPDGAGHVYYAPDAEVLLSDVFLDTHCMRLLIGSGAREGWVGLTFNPVERRRVAEIGGTLWVDPDSWELRHLDYWYENLDRDVPVREVGGHVRFQRLPDGTWIVPEWTIRMPLLGRGTDLSGRPRTHQIGVREERGTVLRLRRPGGAVLLTAGSATIDGVVSDSLGLNPVGGAVVHVVGEGLTVSSDSTGRFMLADLAPGTYRLTLDHPALGGLEDAAPVSTVRVEAAGVHRVGLRLPSQGELMARACTAEVERASADDPGWVTGRVLDAATELPLPGATVRLVVDGGQETTLAADLDGRYRACSVPRATRVTISPSWGAFEGRAGTIIVPANEQLVARDLTLNVEGFSTIAGIVLEGSTNLPVEGARVVLEVDGVAAAGGTSDAFGRFRIVGAPAGAHRLAVSHAAYRGGDTALATRPGEAVDISVSLTRVSPELRRLLPALSARIQGVSVTVIGRTLSSAPSEG